MLTVIEANGSKWAGEEPDPVEKLFEMLEREVLDPTFEKYGNFVDLDPIGLNGKPLYPSGTTHFWGNFYTYSHVFDIASDDPKLVGPDATAEQITDAVKD